MLTLETIERYENQVRDEAVAIMRETAAEDATGWYSFFSDLKDHLKEQMQHAQREERARLQAQLDIVTRASNLFTAGLSLYLKKTLPQFVAAMLHTEFSDNFAQYLANELTDTEPEKASTVLADFQRLQDMRARHAKGDVKGKRK